MGVVGGAKIPLDGLKCMLDVGNTRGGAAGTTLGDVSGNGKNFSASSSMTFNAGQNESNALLTYDRSIDSPSTGLAGAASDSFGITSSTGASFVMVIRQHSKDAKMAFQLYMGDGEGGDARGYFAHITWSNGYCYFDTNGSTSTGSGGGRVNTSDLFDDEAWQCWAFTKNTGSSGSNTQTIYLNGAQVAQRTNAGACPTLSDDAATIGINDQYSSWDADIGIFMCYNRELTATEVKRIDDAIRGSTKQGHDGRYIQP